MTRPIVLTESQLSTAVNALRVAADRFVEDAKTMREQGEPFAGLAEQFERQERDSRNLAAYLEDHS